jgi:pimeloyl-ACP methyl ester carboxylesterase
VNEDKEDEPLPELRFSNWEYGVALKYHRRVFLLWKEAVESCLIDGLNLMQQLHVALPPPDASHTQEEESAFDGTTDPSKVVLLAHGFSDAVGPGYPLMCVLRHMIRRKGWSVVVPDFRGTYAFGPARGRSERVRTILEDLIALHGRPPAVNTVLLVGHSQGGAACAQACTEKVVIGAKIRGLAMLGSESPVEMLPPPYMMGIPDAEHDAQEPAQRVVVHIDKPPLAAENILLVHSARDAVVHHEQIRQLAQAWGVPYIHLESPARADYYCSWSDDVQHDFIACDLLKQVLVTLSEFMDRFS